MDLNNLKSLPIVLVGGGFGGLATATALRGKVDGTPIILIDPNPRFVFKPLLYELLSDELQLWEVAPKYSTLASELGFIYLQETVISVDEYNRKVITSSNLELEYSQLVVSTGLKSNYFGIEGLSENACGFVGLNDVQRIKKLIHKINNANESVSPLVIVGAGPTGVELACKLGDLIDDLVEIYLIDMGNEILPTCKSFNKEKSIQALAKRNIKIHLRKSVQKVSKDKIELKCSNGESYNEQTLNYSGLIWTAGSEPTSSDLFSIQKGKNKKIIVNEYLTNNAYQNIFFVGDISLNEQNPCPASAQVAMQQGSITAKNICSVRDGKPLRPFVFDDHGEMLSLGIENASLTGYGITLSGPLAYEIRYLAYLMRMPGFSLSLRSASSWLIGRKFMN